MKINFPKFNKCCCCMDLATGVKVFTIIFLFLDGLELLLTTTVAQFSDSTTATVVNFICLLFFMIGIKKLNKTYLKQFIYVQLILLILYVLSAIIEISVAINVTDNIYSEIISEIIVISLYLYYYLAGGSYASMLIEEIEKTEEVKSIEEVKNVKEVKNNEENNN